MGKRASVPGCNYIHYILENGSTNGRELWYDIKNGASVSTRALERVARADLQRDRETKGE